MRDILEIMLILISLVMFVYIVHRYIMEKYGPEYRLVLRILFYLTPIVLISSNPIHTLWILPVMYVTYRYFKRENQQEVANDYIRIDNTVHVQTMNSQYQSIDKEKK
jgi:hypothetical protein